MRTFIKLFVLAVIVTFAGAAAADSPNLAPVTPATEIHGAPGNTPGFGGTSANPNGVGDGGNGIHDIADGAPGQNGEPAKVLGEPPACVMHGGLNTVNQKCK